MHIRTLRGKNKGLPDAVLFDFDGVVADTEPLHWKAFCEVFRPLGQAFPWRIYKSEYLGFDDRGVFREHFKRLGLTLTSAELQRLMKAKADAFERLAMANSVRPYPGVVDLIRTLRRDRVPVALCTGALRRDIRPLLRRFHLTRAFDVVVTADDVREGKPNPRVYRVALQRLRRKFRPRAFAAGRCVAIEDTPAGIEAARRAGMNVVGITNTYGRFSLRRATCIVTSLRGKALRKIVASLMQKDV